MNETERESRLLEGLSLGELKGLQQSVAAKIAELEGQMRQEALAELESRAEELGLSQEELRAHFGTKARRKPRTAGAAKYRHPETGEYWTGVGRKPNWVKAFVARGGRLEDLATPEGAKKSSA